MPLGNGSGNYNSGPLVLLNPRTKHPDGKKAKPHFTADRPNEAGELQRDEQTYTEIGGDLFRAETKSRTFMNSKTGKEQTVTEWVLYFRDAEAGYRLPLNQNSTSRDLLNRFASLLETGDFTGLTISYYENKKGRDAFSLKQQNERVDWKYTLEQLPKPREIKDPETGEVIKRDYSKLDAFFDDIVAQIAAALGQRTAAPHAPGPEADQGAADETQVQHEQAPAPAPAPAARPAPRATAAPATTARPAPKATAQAGARPAARPAAKAAPAPAAEPAVAEDASSDVPF